MEKLKIKNFEDLIKKINEGVIVLDRKEDKKKETIFILNRKKNAYLANVLDVEIEIVKNDKTGKYGCLWEKTSELEEILEEYDDVLTGNLHGRVELRDFLGALDFIDKELYRLKEGK